LLRWQFALDRPLGLTPELTLFLQPFGLEELFESKPRCRNSRTSREADA